MVLEKNACFRFLSTIAAVVISLRDEARIVNLQNEALFRPPRRNRSSFDQIYERSGLNTPPCSADTQ